MRSPRGTVVTSELVDQLTGMATLPALSLTSVISTAALQTRRDRKYLVNLEELLATLRSLPSDAGLGMLQVGGRFEQRYRSVYFDTDDLSLYRMAATGRRRRFKVRRRVYVDDGVQRLEVKTKDPRGRTVKTRAEASPEGSHVAAERLSVDESAFVADALSTAGIRQYPRLDSLRVVVYTGYIRTTLAAPAAGWRATIDQDLIGARAGRQAVSLGRCVVVETKSTKGSTPLDRALWASGYRPQPISKFAVVMAMTHPGLAANRWNRVLRGHLDWQPDVCPQIGIPGVCGALM